MSGSASQTPVVSPDYLSAMRQYLRITAVDFDGEITALVLAARKDLTLSGVLPERATDETDPLIQRAVATYVKAEFGLDNEDAENFRAADARLKTALALASEYGSGGEA